MTLRHERAEAAHHQHPQGRQGAKSSPGATRARAGACSPINAQKNTVVVEHADIIKRHTRPNPAKNIKGGIVEKEAAINVSNVHGRLRQLRQAHAHRPHGSAGRHESALPAGAAARRWISKSLRKDKANEEPNAGKIQQAKRCRR